MPKHHAEDHREQDGERGHLQGLEQPVASSASDVLRGDERLPQVVLELAAVVDIRQHDRGDQRRPARGR